MADLGANAIALETLAARDRVLGNFRNAAPGHFETATNLMAAGLYSEVLDVLDQQAAGPGATWCEFYRVRALYALGRNEAALAVNLDPASSTEEMSRTLIVQAWAARKLGQYDRCSQLRIEAVQLCDTLLVQADLAYLDAVTRRDIERDYTSARREARFARAVFERLGDIYSLPRIIVFQGSNEHAVGNIERALFFANEALHVAASAGNCHQVQNALSFSTTCRLRIGDINGARTMVTEGLRLHEQVPHPHMAVNLRLNALRISLLSSTDPDEWTHFQEAAARSVEESGGPYQRILLDEYSGLLALAAHEPEEALDLFKRSEAGLIELGWVTYQRSEAKLRLAQAYIALDLFEDAEREAVAGLEHLSTLR